MIAKFIWKYIDVICFVIAIALACWGFFRIGITAGIFASAVGFLLLGILVDAAANVMHK